MEKFPLCRDCKYSEINWDKELICENLCVISKELMYLVNGEAQVYCMKARAMSFSCSWQGKRCMNLQHFQSLLIGLGKKLRENGNGKSLCSKFRDV